MMKNLLCLILFSAAAFIHGAGLPGDLKVVNAANIKWGDASISFSSIYGNWQEPKVGAAKITLQDGGVLEAVSAADFKSESVEYRTRLTPVGEDAFKLRLEPGKNNAVTVNQRYLGVAIPVKSAVAVEYRTAAQKSFERYELPAKFEKVPLFEQKEIGRAHV